MPQLVYRVAEGDKIVIGWHEYTLREDPEEGHGNFEAVREGAQSDFFTEEELYSDFEWSVERNAWVAKS